MRDFNHGTRTGKQQGEGMGATCSNSHFDLSADDRLQGAVLQNPGPTFTWPAPVTWVPGQPFPSVPPMDRTSCPLQ